MANCPLICAILHLMMHFSQMDVRITVLNVNTNGSWFPVVLSAKSKSISAKEKFISSNERLSYQSFVEKVLIGFIENEKKCGVETIHHIDMCGMSKQTPPRSLFM